MFLRMTYRHLSILAAVGLLTVSCQETDIQGALKENRPPKTYLTLDGVDRPDDNRLNSQVRIRWWGDDPDGYVTGYQYNINNTGWRFTAKTDSVFVLPIPTGSETADVLFSIRAIDNQGALDPAPPSLTFPIVNSKPDIRFNTVEQPSDTTFHVFSFGWSASDPDGSLNLDHTEIAINDTVNGWVTMPDGVNFVTVNIGNGSGATATGQIFLGKAYVSSALTLPGIVMNGQNTFYVRAVDQAGARSTIERKTWYVKRQTSRVLVVNDDASPNTQTRLNNHLNWLRQSGITTVDVMQATDGTATGGFKAPLSAAFQKTLDPTMNKTFAKWDYIYWVSENLDRNITYALEMTVDFFREGGRMYINIPTKTLPSSDPVFTFLPFDRLGVPGVTGAQGFLIQSNTALTPVDVLTAPAGRIGAANITGVSPLVPSGGSKVLYNAVFRVRQLIGSQLYTGNPAIAVLGSDGNMAFLGLDAASINPADIQPMIRFIVIDQLGFQN
jgi:hypothetical protein